MYVAMLQRFYDSLQFHSQMRLACKNNNRDVHYYSCHSDKCLVTNQVELVLIPRIEGGL